LTARIPVLFLALWLAAFPVEAALRAEFKDTVEAEVAAFRAALDNNILDEDAYFTLVIGLELKGELDGDLDKFAVLMKTLFKPGDTIVNYHRLAAALRHREHTAEATYVDNEANADTWRVVHTTIS